MSISDEDEYGDIAYEDLIEAFSQASQSLPPLPGPPPAKRRRIGDDDAPTRHRRRSQESIESEASENEVDENGRTKKSKHKIHFGNKEIPAARILGATQADALPDSSPYRIRGPIYMKPRPEPPKVPLASVTENFPNQSSFLGKERYSLSNGFVEDLDEIPSDLLFEDPKRFGSSQMQGPRLSSSSRQRPVAPSQGLRQTTLFGGRAPVEPSASQAKKVNNFVVDMPPEAPTQHALDWEALKTWIYPTNLGKIRDYQYSIVRNGLFHNTLVALPTGLGKTFIAATIMYNFYRWTKDAKIVFVAPTKPLVAQQVDACFNIVGIPKSQTTMLTGEQQPALRAEEWADKRVFFMTPQTLENDLSSGIADPKKIVLLVVDEAHRATGNYAYVKVVGFLRRFSKSFRVLALTATPGASVEAVQEVIDSLEISKVEIRTEEAIDIQQYVHRRDIDQIILDPSEEMNMIKELFAKSLQSLVSQLCGQNAYWNKDPMALTTFGMVQARKAWFASGAGKTASMGLKGMMHALFSTLASVAHAIKLLNFHGIGPFYSAIKEFRQSGESTKKGGGKYRKQILDHDDFKKMMDRIQSWINKDDFIGHPKLTYLCDTILNHFLDAGEGRLGEDAPPSNTRVIVFAEFRDSAEDITRVLNRHGPMIRASVFVGQADSKRSEGMNQAKQIETIGKFKKGVVNVLVATSIGEEGLDIGQVDLIVCYDASGSPIRMLQRMGRTGRKRAGNIVLLLMRGKEEEAFAKAKDNYEQMQKMISSGTRFNFRHDLSVRIIPRDTVPEVDKRAIDIPLENTQDPSLPQPKRRRATTTKKKPPKKFHMPDGVETGFQKASNLSGKAVTLKNSILSTSSKDTHLAPIPSVNSVLLSASDLRELECRYQHVAGNDVQEVSMPELTCYPISQRVLSPVVNVRHGRYTKRCVSLFQALARCQQKENRQLEPYGNVEPSQESWDVPALIEDNEAQNVRNKMRTATKKQKDTPRNGMILSDLDSEDEAIRSAAQRRQQQELTSTMISTESEGQGDDLMDSEEPSIDDSDGDSLDDFIVGEEHRSTAAEQSPLVRSSTTPPPRTWESDRNGHLTKPLSKIDLGSSGEESTNAHKLASSDVEIVLESDEDVRPAGKRLKRSRAVEESDSDE